MRVPSFRRAAAMLVCGVIAVALAACTSGGQKAESSDLTSAPAKSAPGTMTAPASAPPTPGPSSRTPGSRCTLSTKLVPSCGLLWGVVTSPHTMARIGQVESRVGRTFNLVYRFHDVHDRLPIAMERQLVADGKILHVSIDATDFADQAQHAVTYRDIAAGRYDTDLTAEAQGVRSLRVPVFVTFDHEANIGSHARRGPPAEFVAAWRHLHDVFARAGASNAVWVWVMAGSTYNTPHARGMWPGNSYVDWIGWDVYDTGGCARGRIDSRAHVPFEHSMSVFYRWLQTNAAAEHIDLSKPMMLSEAASIPYPGDAALTASWYAAMPSVLARYPAIKAVTLWDNKGSSSSCDFTFDSDAAITRAVASAGRSPRLAAAEHVGNLPGR